jgi:glutaredoxin
MLRNFILTFAFSAIATTAAAQSTQPQPAQPVVMYATSWCPYCAKARAYFAKNGIAYVEHDIEKSAAGNAEYRRLGGRGVPLILVGTEKMSGFSERGLDALLARAGRRR